MYMAYSLRHTRLIYSKKLPDRFLSCQITTGTDADKVGKNGTIVTLIEINSHWQQATNMGQIMANRLSREFFRGTSNNAIANFENAVRQVNEAIATNEMEKDPEWRQKINAFLALIINNEVHFTQIGNIWSDILRNKKLLKVSDPNTQGHTPANFIFSSLTSGHLEDDDIITIGTKKMIEFPSEISTVVHHPSQIAPYIIGREKKREIFAGVIMQINTKESLSLKETAQYPEIIYLDQPLELVSKKIKYKVNNSLIPLLKSGLNKTVDASRKIHKYSREKIWPHISKRLSRAYKKSSLTIKQTGQNIAKGQRGAKDDNYKINYYNRSEDLVKSSRSIPIKLNFTLRKIKRLNFVKLSIFKGKNLYITIAVVLLVILTIVSFNKYLNAPKVIDRDSVKVKIAKIGKQSDEARNAILYGEEAKAREILQNAINQANDIKNQIEDSAELETVITQLYSQLDQMDKVTRLNHEAEFVSPKDASKIFSINGKLWDISTDGKFYQAPAAGGSFSTLGIKVSGLKSTTSNEKSNAIYIQDNDKKVYKFSTQNDTLTELTTEANQWEEASSMAFYVNNLYLSNSTLGNIFKYPAKDNEFAVPQTYLSKTLAEIKDITIDGSVYLLVGQGEIKKAEKGKISDFSIKNLPTNVTIADFSKIFTSPDREYLYISTKNRLIVIDKTGTYINQYAFDQNDQIKDFYFSDKGTLMWILTDKKILSYNLR